MAANYGPNSFHPLQRLEVVGDGIQRDHVSEARAAQKRWGDFKMLLRRVPAHPQDTRTPKVQWDTSVRCRKTVVSSDASKAFAGIASLDKRPFGTRRQVQGDGRKADLTKFMK